MLSERGGQNSFTLANLRDGISTRLFGLTSLTVRLSRLEATMGIQTATPHSGCTSQNLTEFGKERTKFSDQRPGSDLWCCVGPPLPYWLDVRRLTRHRCRWRADRTVARRLLHDEQERG
jgi:hypothetical protein